MRERVALSFAFLFHLFCFPPSTMQSYEQLFRDVRKCVDLCHRDGVIKDRVEEDPERYIIPDPQMVPMLKRFRKEGVQVYIFFKCGFPEQGISSSW